MLRHSWRRAATGEGRHRFNAAFWVLLAVGVIVLLAAHAFLIQFAVSHLTASAGGLAGMLILVLLIKHLGWLGPLLTWIRRRTAQRW